MTTTDTEPAPIFGLVLAGGESRRMGRDKAALTYGGQTQLERAIALIGPFVERSFVSVRAGGTQPESAARAGAEAIPDGAEVAGIGPLGGILSALRTHPQTAWLVLAVDLPLLDAATLEHLIAHRDPTRLATAYRSSRDGLPEPLCAIYEPHAEPILAEFHAGRGIRCPRKILINSDAHLLDLPNPGALDNVNHPDEYARAAARLAGPPQP